ncbi:MAG: hypothetical protein ACI4M3_00840 [Acutalibacteraceae bacterium]
MSKMNKKRVTIAILSTALIGTIAVGSSLAFLTDSATKTNHINITTDLETSIDEGEWPDDPADEPELLPGDIYEKQPAIVTNSAVYARFKLTYIDQETGDTITDPDRIALIKQTIKYDPEHATLPLADTDGNKFSYTLAQIAGVPMFNTTDYFEQEDETEHCFYYYYKTNDYVLSGETAPFASNPLFTTIVIPSDWANNATHNEINVLGKFNIQIDAEVIQADNNTLPDTVTNDTEFATWFAGNYAAPSNT